ncbi:MAG: hypothetical protein GXO89_01615, partial [Chlorobi bacterium]|nr:hypothetical protein [Chlorobiota bacterium]
MEFDINTLKQKVEEAIKEYKNKPFVVSVMGQTGVGKSSLTNAIFNTKFDTDPVKPCTKSIQSVEILNKNGDRMIFNDLPGIGESEVADEHYIAEYVKIIKVSDVVLWLFHGDNRSVRFDIENLKKIMSKLSEEERFNFMSKITFALSKVDLITPPAWYYVLKNSGNFFLPCNETKKILKLKKQYYLDAILEPFARYILSRTPNTSNFNKNIEGFSLSEDREFVIYKGYLTTEKVEDLSQEFPNQKEIFLRLHENYSVVPTSTIFKYNLSLLVTSILNKINDGAIFRIEKFIDDENISVVPIEKALTLGNIIVYDNNI